MWIRLMGLLRLRNWRDQLMLKGNMGLLMFKRRRGLLMWKNDEGFFVGKEKRENSLILGFYNKK
jgi:hypothetical protein